MSALAELAGRTLPRRSDYSMRAADWRADVTAGITVGVVALPLALGFGVASGAGPAAGIITAIVAGIVAAIFGGSNLQVSGPTGAMTVVLLPAVAQHGVASLPVLAVMAGVLVVIGGLLGLGRAVTLVPWPVVEGFTLGIAVVIFLQQVVLLLDPTPAVGHDAIRATWDALAGANWQESAAPIALAVAVIALAALVTAMRPVWPASLLALVVVTGVSVAADLDVATIGSISFVPDLPAPLGSLAEYGDLMRPAIVIALLAVLESLLSARVADGMSDTSKTDPDRELFGQGLANIAAGLAGGIPATGAIARTAVNVRAGARTRVASAMHSVAVLVMVVAGASLVGRIPLAALAGVLMFTAIRMVDLGAMRVLLTVSRSDALIYSATAVATVALDLIRAVELGVAISALLALRAAARLSDVHEEDARAHLDDARVQDLLAQHVVIYRLQGSLFFGAAQRFVDRLARLDEARVVVLRLGSLHVLDSSGAHAIAEQLDEFRSHDIAVLLCGIQPNHRRFLDAVGIPGERIPEARCFDDIEQAVEAAVVIARREEPAGA